MSHKEATSIIALIDEHTATECTYEVSCEIADMLTGMSEEEFLSEMPLPAVTNAGYASVAYGNAIVELAKRHGIDAGSIIVKCVSNVMQFSLSPSTSADSLPDDAYAIQSAAASSADTAHSPLTRHEECELKAYMSDVYAGHQMTQDEIIDFMQLAELVDGQSDSEPHGDRNRFVRVLKAFDAYFAVAPTYDTAHLPVEQREWEQPYVVRKASQRVTIDSIAWVSSTQDGTEMEPAKDERHGSLETKPARNDSPRRAYEPSRLPVEFPAEFVINPDERLLEHVRCEHDLIEWLGDRMFGNRDDCDRFRPWGFYRDVHDANTLLLSVMQSRDDGIPVEELGIDPFALYRISIRRDGFGNPLLHVRLVTACDTDFGVDGYEILKAELNLW